MRHAPALALANVLLFAPFSVAQTAPVAVDDAYSTTQDDNLSVDAPGVLSNDSDADGDPLTAVLVDSSQAVGLLVLESDGSFEYEPRGFVGVDSFTYLANDGTQDSNLATITFTVTPGSGAQGYRDEALFLSVLAQSGFVAVKEGFEDGAVWPRTPATAPSVTSKGITWESPIGVSEVTTGPGPARRGSYGFFALPHGDYLAGPQCLTPGVCTDRWKGSTAAPLVAIGGWISSAGQGSIELYLDGDTTNPIDFGGGGFSGWSFFGVIAPAGFHSFEFREMEGTSDDAVYIFGDSFTFAWAAPSPWVDLGHGLAGTYGEPLLDGTGTLLGGDPVQVSLSGALENTTAFLIVGIERWDIPFRGGVWVPSLDLFPMLMPTGAGGEITLDTLWPGDLPPGFTTYLQYWILDPAGPRGFSASNALSATAQ